MAELRDVDDIVSRLNDLIDEMDKMIFDDDIGNVPRLSGRINGLSEVLNLDSSSSYVSGDIDVDNVSLMSREDIIDELVLCVDDYWIAVERGDDETTEVSYGAVMALVWVLGEDDVDVSEVLNLDSDELVEEYE